MRQEREFYKPKNAGVFLHIYNHCVAMDFNKTPFGVFEKKMFIYIMERYLPKYNIEIISLVLMGNHFHALVHCPPEKMSLDQAYKAYNKFHRKGENKIPREDKRIKAVVKHSNNISELMREVQREFSFWYNRSRIIERKGSLWQDRFQSQLIESDVYLYSCLKYIELNPVRAKLVDNAEDYPYSTVGRWNKSGSHPYESSFINHILKLSKNKISIKKAKESLEMQLRILKKSDLSTHLQKIGKIEEAKTVREEIRLIKINDKSEAKIILFNHLDWKGKKVIGSEAFIKEKYRQWISGRNTA